MLLLAFLAFVSLSTPATAAGERSPFPRHTQYTRGSIKPSCDPAELDRAVLAFYKAWKAKYLRQAASDQLYVFANAEKSFDLRATRSVSEGHGYGMLAAVLMAGADPEARADFDALYRFFRAHPTETHADLMAWRQVDQNGQLVEQSSDRDSATDGDLDIAYALLLADRQWGSHDSIDYLAEARKVMSAILKGETHPICHTPALGDWVDSESRNWGGLRSSDIVPGHFKAFAAASGAATWTEVADASYSVLLEIATRFSPITGLVPDFIVRNGNGYAPAPARWLEGPHDGDYSYNACRVPWRLGTDYLLTGDRRALTLLRPINAFLAAVTGGDPKQIHAGYKLNGKRLNEEQHLAFTAPLAVAAMAEASDQAWLDALWGRIVDRRVDQETYYGNSIKLLTMIVVSGNWW